MIFTPALDQEHELLPATERVCEAMDDFFAADAIADARLEEVASFAARAQFSHKPDVVEFALLNFAAYEAEHRRREARHRVALALCAAVEGCNQKTHA